MRTSLFPPLVRNVIYPIYRGLRGDRLLTVLDELERNQWLSPGELHELQWRSMESFLRQITTHSPYYRDLFEESGLRVEDIQNPTDFQKIPFLTKDTIQETKSRIVTKDPMRRGYPTSTGGSTGEPLYFYRDVAAGPIRRANTLRCYRWAGVDIGDAQAVLWGFRLEKPLKERLGEAVRNYFNNIMCLSTFGMSERVMHGYARRLRRYQPSLLIGYPSALALFANFCKRRFTTGIHPRAVVTSGESLFPHQREVIEEVFACPVFDRYGNREFSTIAHECEEHRGLHVFNDLFSVEIIHESGRPARSGEVGEIVITDLSNLYMPSLRYRTGDLAIPTERRCPCGRGLPLLDRVEGRAFDTIQTPNGKSVGGFFWTWLSREVPGIKQFQIEQRERSGVIFKIVPGPAWKDGATKHLEKKIKENCGDSFRVNFIIVDRIPLTPTGKFKFIVSNIEERLIVKSKIHKAHVTNEAPGKVDCIVVDEELMERSNLAPGEKILIVDNTNGARIETFVVACERGSGNIITCGATTQYVHTGDEISIMAFTWSDESSGRFSNILVDEDNKFVRYLTDTAGERL